MPEQKRVERGRDRERQRTVAGHQGEPHMAQVLGARAACYDTHKRKMSLRSCAAVDIDIETCRAVPRRVVSAQHLSLNFPLEVLLLLLLLLTRLLYQRLFYSCLVCIVLAQQI